MRARLIGVLQHLPRARVEGRPAQLAAAAVNQASWAQRNCTTQLSMDEDDTSTTTSHAVCLCVC
jgi:hypothetical protein